MAYPRYHPRSELPPSPSLSRARFDEEFPSENSWIEFKSGISGEKLREALIAFSNADGGVVLIGIGPKDRALVGVDEPGEAERDLRDKLSGAVNPGRFDILNVEIEGTSVLALSIDRRREGFAQTSDGRILQRRGARNAALLGPDLSRFVQRHAFEPFEGVPTDVAFDSVDPSAVERVAAVYGVPAEALSERLHDEGTVLVEGGRTVLATAAACMLLDAPQDVLGRVGIEVLRYTGAEIEPDRREVLTGPVDELVRAALRAVQNELGRQSVLVGSKRVEMERLPEVALRETIANAVAHRSYEARGTWTRIEIRPDRVVVRSPGSLPEPVTLRSIRTSQSARNPRLLRYLRRAELAEDMGFGIDRIEDEMATALLEDPGFEEGPDWFEVTLRVSGTFAPEERAWVAQLRRQRTLTPIDARLVVHAGREGVIGNGSARRWLDVDREAARQALQRLRDAGVLVQSGERGGARYRLAPELGMPSAADLDRPARKRVIVEMARKAEVTNRAVRQRLGIASAQATTLLNELMKEGELIRVGSRRGTRYRLP